MLNVRNVLAVITLAAVISFSGHVSAQATVAKSITDAEMIKTIEAIKLEIAQHTGIQAYYDEKSQIVTLSGSTDDMAYVSGLISKLESFDHVKEVRSSITRSE